MAVNFKACAVSGCKNNAHWRAGGALEMCRAHYLRNRTHGDPTAGGKMQAKPGEALRYLHDVLIHHRDATTCVTWPFSKSNGAGMIWAGGKNQRVSRLVCELRHGPPPTPLHHAAHSCGKGHEACVNPEHLSWKTPPDNNQDKLEHGTHNRGERHSLMKLREGQVLEIFAMRGVASSSAIAAKFGVHKSTVKCIHSGRTWAWLTGEK